MTSSTAKPTNATKPRKRFIGSKSFTSHNSTASRTIANQIPEYILNDPNLNNIATQLLPANYSFEIHKTIHHVRKNDAKMVALQMPEGLQMFACTIADIIERFTNASTVILGDVTYGACCIDDFTAVALGCDFLVHYGHSCLVPMDQTTIKTLYVFVEIAIDSSHLVQTIRLNLPDDRQEFHEFLESEGLSSQIPLGQKMRPNRNHLQIEPGPSSIVDQTIVRRQCGEATKLALVSTIQFVAALSRLKNDLTSEYTDLLTGGEELHQPRVWRGRYEATIPRTKPLSPGEILGCTAPRLNDVDALIYLGDGRFHLESIMIANPTVPAFRYDPYTKKLTRELYDHKEMQRVRGEAVNIAKRSIGVLSNNRVDTVSNMNGRGMELPIWGVVLGTLGRQGSFKQLQECAITSQLQSSTTPIPYIPILLSELSPAKLSLFNPHISTFVQTSCPRLSIDWGYAFERPLLSVYECAVTVGSVRGWFEDGEQKGDGVNKLGVYPMDFYEAGSLWAVARTKASF